MGTDDSHKGVILLVDDEEWIRDALSREVRILGYEVLTADCGPRALEMVAEHPIDIVISDHSMPGMSGIELIKELRRSHPEILRIMLTGHADVDLAIHAINDGEVYRFLLKPWDSDQLERILVKGFESLSMVRKLNGLKDKVHKQDEYISRLEEENPGIAEVNRDESGAIRITDEELAAVESMLSSWQEL